MHFRRPLDYLAYLVLRMLICMVQALPLSLLEELSGRLGWLFWNVLRMRRGIVEENLQTAFPDKSKAERDAIGLAMWRHLFLMVCEIAHAPRKVHRTNWRHHSSIPQIQAMLRVLVDDCPVVVISAHLGNFELGGYLMALHGFPTHTVARRLDNEYVDRYVNRFRSATGQHMLSKKGSSGEIADLLNSGGTLALLGDQFGGRRGCWVEFFGRPASTHKAVGVLSITSAAPAVVSVALRGKRPLDIEMRMVDLADPREEGFALSTVPLFAQWYMGNLERLIRSCPEQYWWVHRRWKGDPEDRHRVRKARKAMPAAA